MTLLQNCEYVLCGSQEARKSHWGIELRQQMSERIGQLNFAISLIDAATKLNQKFGRISCAKIVLHGGAL